MVSTSCEVQQTVLQEVRSAAIRQVDETLLHQIPETAHELAVVLIRHEVHCGLPEALSPDTLGRGDR